MLNNTNELTGAEALVEMLRLHGVKHVFGLCGDTTLPFYDAMARMDHGMTHLLTRDERHAGYMADGYARVTGKVGVCEGPSGGGATYILPGVVEANESSIPILAITSDVSTSSRGRYPLTELDQKGLFKPLTKWNEMLDQSDRLPAQVRAAFTAMTTGKPGAAHLGLPFDTQKGLVSQNEIHANQANGQFPSSRTRANDADIDVALDLLVSTKEALIVCGGGVVLSNAEDELLELARAFNLPIATTVSGQGSVAETDALALGVVGSNGGVSETRAIVDQADLIFYIGCRAGSVTTERWRSPLPGTTIVHLDVDPQVVGANYSTQSELIGDAKATLGAMNRRRIERKISADHNGATRIAPAVKAKFEVFEQYANSTETPIRPERMIKALQNILEDSTIICADPGTPCPYFSAYYRWPQAGRNFITNRAHGALGYALAASMGAHVGRPDVKTIAVMGDGSFGFCCGEMETMVRYKMPITMIVMSNSVYGWIKAGQDAGFGKRYYNVDFNRTDHRAVAEAFGVKSWRVEDPMELENVLRKAIAHDGPSLVDIISQELQDTNAPVSEWIA